MPIYVTPFVVKTQKDTRRLISPRFGTTHYKMGLQAVVLLKVTLVLACLLSSTIAEHLAFEYLPLIIGDEFSCLGSLVLTWTMLRTTNLAMSATISKEIGLSHII